MSNWYYSKVDTSDRKAMIDYLNNHFRYHTMNSWNQSTSYANRVKIYDLGIPEDIKDKAWSFVLGEFECPDWDYFLEDTFFTFMKETGFAAGINGRNGGYIVLYDTGVDNTGKTVVYPGRSIDMYANFDDGDEWDMDSLCSRVKLIQAFDKMCDELREEFIYLLRNSEVEEYEVVKATIHKRLVSV